jgi:superfamily I DNA and/or RNA helicase
MTKAIGDLISHVFYADQLLTERTETLEGYDLALPKPVIWLSTSGLPYRQESRAGPGGVSFQNAAEADALVDFLIRLSLVHGSKKRRDRKNLDVLVLAAYRPQVTMLQARIDAQLDKLGALNIEVNTVDAAQGREADVVAVSVTRSNPKGGAGFLSEPRRINVALSRARVGLAIVGDLTFCEREPGALRDVIEYVRAHPDDCHVEMLEAGAE